MSFLATAAILAVAIGSMWIPQWFAGYYMRSQKYRSKYDDIIEHEDPELQAEMRRGAAAERDAYYASGFNIGVFIAIGITVAVGWLLGPYAMIW